MKKYFIYFLIIILFSKMLVLSSCANIIPPTGGPKDTLPPKLMNALPKDSITSFNAKNIVLTFDEYVQLDNPSDNIVVSPNPENQPNISSKLRTVTIKLRDSLLPNTTYTISFGNSLKDINEGNIKKNFSYVFSTGKSIDHNIITGKVVLAETGGIDSTLIVVLQKNLADSAIIKHRPLYYAKLDGKGNFQIRNLPADTFAVYALTNDYTKRYDDSTKIFAFLNNPVVAADSSSQIPVKLFAYAEFREKPKKPTGGSTVNGTASNSDNSALSSDEKKKIQEEKKHLRFETNLDNFRQDVLGKFQITFSHKLKVFDTSKISFTDTNFVPVKGASFSLDTSATIVTLLYKWPFSKSYKLSFDKTAFIDSAGHSLNKSDTLVFFTKGEGDYGSITLRFTGLNFTKNPVLQMVENEKVVDSAALTKNEWHRDVYEPGEYKMRILYDENKNLTWDPGDFKKKLQPEIVQSILKTVKIRSDWENEEEINLNETQPQNSSQKKNN